jgi:hypothetical protein
MYIKPWSRLPTLWITDGRIRDFVWKTDGAAGTAALILYVVLCHCAVERGVLPKANTEASAAAPLSTAEQYAMHLGDAQPSSAYWTAANQYEPAVLVETDYIAYLTYDAMGELTGVSRKLIAAGLKLLVERHMIERVGSERSGEYRIADLEPLKRWAKLPGQALLSPAKTCFLPLTRFDLRGKHSLNAMKLYLYYASVRSTPMAYSQPSFETSFLRTGVQERDIPRANSILLSVGLLARYSRPDFSDDDDVSMDDPKVGYGSNRYYMTGYASLFAKGKGGKSSAAQADA